MKAGKFVHHPCYPEECYFISANGSKWSWTDLSSSTEEGKTSSHRHVVCTSRSAQRVNYRGWTWVSEDVPTVGRGDRTAQEHPYGMQGSYLGFPGLHLFNGFLWLLHALQGRYVIYQRAAGKGDRNDGKPQSRHMIFCTSCSCRAGWRQLQTTVWKLLYDSL